MFLTDFIRSTPYIGILRHRQQLTSCMCLRRDSVHSCLPQAKSGYTKLTTQKIIKKQTLVCSSYQMKIFQERISTSSQVIFLQIISYIHLTTGRITNQGLWNLELTRTKCSKCLSIQFIIGQSKIEMVQTNMLQVYN